MFSNRSKKRCNRKVKDFLVYVSTKCCSCALLLLWFVVLTISVVSIVHEMNQAGASRNHKKKIKIQQMSVLITTYKQHECLDRQIAHLDCPVVGEIRVNWFTKDQPPYDLYPDVTFDLLQDRFSHRFKPRDFKFPAVFNVDVDTLYSCRALAFVLFHFSNSTAAGFHPRRVTPTGYGWDSSYNAPYLRNTLFVTKGGVIPSFVFERFWQYSDMRALVDEQITAEDILMSFVLAEEGVKTAMVCIEPQDQCSANCTNSNTKSLGQRTRGARSGLISQFYEHFGNPFEDMTQGAKWIEQHNASWDQQCLSRTCDGCNCTAWENTFI